MYMVGFFEAEQIAQEHKAGMFTPAHFIALAVCFVVIAIAIYFTRNIKEKTLRKITFIMAITFTVLEIIKITYKFAVCHRPFSKLDYWFPLYYCSLFIYALWMSSATNAYIRKLGDAFISCGCITGGLGFLIFPTTSLQLAPIYHFLSLHSLLFHSCMIYLCIMYIMKGLFEPSRKEWLNYVVVMAVFMIPAELLNIVFGCNLMMLRQPFNIPIQFIQDIYINAPSVWTLGTIVTYITGPFGVSCLVYLIIWLVRNKWTKPKKIEEVTNEQ